MRIGMVKEWDQKDKEGTCSSIARCESTRSEGKGRGGGWKERKGKGRGRLKR